MVEEAFCPPNAKVTAESATVLLATSGAHLFQVKENVETVVVAFLSII